MYTADKALCCLVAQTNLTFCYSNGPYTARLLCLWEDHGIGCHFLLQKGELECYSSIVLKKRLLKMIMGNCVNKWRLLWHHSAPAWSESIWLRGIKNLEVAGWKVNKGWWIIITWEIKKIHELEKKRRRDSLHFLCCLKGIM